MHTLLPAQTILPTQTPRVRVRTAPPYEPAGADMAGRAVTSESRRSTVGAGPSAGSARKTVAAAAEARRFSIAVSRLLFEVIDRRRAIGHLGDVVSPAVADQVGVLVRHDAFRIVDPASPLTQAPVGTVLQRVHVQMCDISAAEIFGSYAAGARVRAFAGRIERKPCRVRGPREPGTRRSLGQVEYRWQLVALEFH